MTLYLEQDEGKLADILVAVLGDGVGDEVLGVSNAIPLTVNDNNGSVCFGPSNARKVRYSLNQ